MGTTRKLKQIAVGLGLALGLAWSAPATVAQARPDDGGSMYGRPNVDFSYHPVGARKSTSQKNRRQSSKRERRQKVVKTPKHDRSVSLNGVVQQLASKAREIVKDCGSVIVSAVSRRGNRSNHPLGRAVDIQGNPRCIYAHLKSWPGGVSTDYATAPGGKHVHVSYNPGGQEWGLRFAHRNPFDARRHHAKRTRHIRVANAHANGTTE